MNKSAIQKFATSARREMIEQVKARARIYAITEDGYDAPDAEVIGGRALTLKEIKLRAALIKHIERSSFDRVMEEAAYTWFNRFVALRFMEVNGYLPLRIRVLSGSDGSSRPEILSHAMDIDLPGFTAADAARFINASDDEGMFRAILLAQCNALGEILPKLFEKMDSFMELLLPGNILGTNSIVSRLVANIEEDDWRDQVQIVGWMYQYYNSELKDETFSLLKTKNIKISKERIPSATQLFTPDWIVRYMVENSLGRLWMEARPDCGLKEGWQYYIDDAEQTPEVEARLAEIRASRAEMGPEDIRLIDPCVGSGHILAYAFDVLLEIYLSEGYTRADAARCIVEKNLHGLDIDRRAAQLAYFAVMMKARGADDKFFARGIVPRVFVVEESESLSGDEAAYFEPVADEFGKLVERMRGGREVGSLIDTSDIDLAAIRVRANEVAAIKDDIYAKVAADRVGALLDAAELLSVKYDVVVTNPPYMGSGNMNKTISNYVGKHYSAGKSDLYGAFIIKCIDMCEDTGLLSLMTSFTWMFLSDFQLLRENIIFNHTLLSLIQPEYHSFYESAHIPICMFTFRKNNTRVISTFIKIDDRDSALQSVKVKEAIRNLEHRYRYEFDIDNLRLIKGSPLAYWASKAFYDCYHRAKALEDVFPPKSGTSTGDNNKFLRLWHEVSLARISLSGLNDKKWYPLNKGGEFRRWYGNQEYVVDWDNDGYEIKNYTDERGKKNLAH